MKLLNIFVTICLLYEIHGEEYNLFGEAGQAYSLEVYLGRPKQKLRLIVDTGSTTLAVASYARRDNNEYFHVENSTTLHDTGKEVRAKYSQGNWVGHYVSDYVEIPSIKQYPNLRSDFAVITKSHKFFMNGSGWQGLMGLAYLPVGAWGDRIIVGSWLDSLESYLDQSISFALKLCGVQSPINATHYGKFEVRDIKDKANITLPSFRTTILHKRWYEVGVLAVNVRPANHSLTNDSQILDEAETNIEMCQKLNEQKSIIDSGTTNIRLPDEIYKKVVDELRKESQLPGMLILDEFWDRGEAACWPQPQDWLVLPWITIDLISDCSDQEYFTLEIPPQNYMRVVTARNNSGEDGAVSQFCYKLGLEAGGSDTVLGYTAMEGLEVIFNRTAGWIGFEPSDCGPNARVTGPYYARYSLFQECKLGLSDSVVAVSIRAAQWALCAVSILAAILLAYLLAPCVKVMLHNRRRNSMASSRDALVDQELS